MIMPSKTTSTLSPALSQVNSIDLRKLHPMDEALELMYFGWRGMTREADRYLATLGLTRVHHRILYSIARGNDLTISDLLVILDISKQALHRPMTLLIDKGYVTTAAHPTMHRFKILQLTAAGRKVENQASEHERRVMARAFKSGGAKAFGAWSDVMRETAKG
jgi:DNA-binding MarR family transcriptional regulator